MTIFKNHYKSFITFGKVIRCPSNASVIRQATIAVDRRYIVRTMCTILIARRLLGFIHAFIAGDAVLSKFQSNLKNAFIISVIQSQEGAVNLSVLSNSVTYCFSIFLMTRPPQYQRIFRDSLTLFPCILEIFIP